MSIFSDFTNLKAKIEYVYSYKDLKENLPANSIIYLAGDIAHAKTEMSPELIEMTSDLFTKLSNF